MKVKMEDEKGNDIYNPEKEQAGDTAQDAKVLNFSVWGFELCVFEILSALSLGKSKINEWLPP